MTSVLMLVPTKTKKIIGKTFIALIKVGTALSKHRLTSFKKLDLQVSRHQASLSLLILSENLKRMTSVTEVPLLVLKFIVMARNMNPKNSHNLPILKKLLLHTNRSLEKNCFLKVVCARKRETLFWSE